MNSFFLQKLVAGLLSIMPNKPDKFGIKFWLAVDVDTKYILNAIPYLGKEESRAKYS